MKGNHGLRVGVSMFLLLMGGCLEDWLGTGWNRSLPGLVRAAVAAG